MFMCWMRKIFYTIACLPLAILMGSKERIFLASAEGEWVEVLSGLEAGERVFLETEKAEEGALVDVQS